MSFEFDRDISVSAKAWMNLLGNFSPTARPERKEIKGLTFGEYGKSVRTYYDSGELRELTKACIEVADWLDRRAQ